MTFNNQQFSEIMKNGLNEIRQEIKGIVNGKYIDTVFEIDKVKQECKSDFIHVRNDIASIYEKIHQIETKELKVLHEKIHQKETSIIKELLREGILMLILRTEWLIKEKNITSKFINTHAILREEFLREISWIHKLIEQLDKKFKSLQ